MKEKEEKNIDMKKTIIILFLLAAIGCSKVQHECVVIDKYRTIYKYGTYLVLKDKNTGQIYEECVNIAQYITPIGGSITITKYE